jgi:hypothetical protein
MMHTSIFHFHKVLYFFWVSLLQVFRCFLGLGCFDRSKIPLARKKTSLPITFDGIGFISTLTITPTTYLGSWAFVISIIAIRFMVDQRPFLLKFLTRVDNNTFIFQQCLKATWGLLPPPIYVCLPPFEQFIEQQMVQFQNSISKHLHHHTLSNMFFNEIFETHHA